MIEGSLHRLHLGDLLQWLQMGRLSGRLALIEPHCKRHLDFLDGNVVFASSTAPEERLASWLASEGVMPAATLRRLLAVSLLRRTLFTDLVIERGGCPPEDLLRSLARLAETVTSRVLAAPEVRFVLDPGYPVRQLLGLRLTLEPNLLMMEAARRSDESPPPSCDAGGPALPVAGEALDAFFRDLVREGITDDDRVDGEDVARLLELLRQITRTLSSWVGTGPGLVPMPRMQAESIGGLDRRPGALDLSGLPHLVWNQMVLACSVRNPTLPHPLAFEELYARALDLDVWHDLAAGDRWHRPVLGELDHLAARTAAGWARAAGAAAPHLGVAAGTARLAVHLVVVPTDLVLWVLANVPVPHRGVRSALLRRLPGRLGVGLAQLADFPEPLPGLFSRTVATRLGVCLDVARRAVSVGQVWPSTVPDDHQQLGRLTPAEALHRAETAARLEVMPVLVGDHPPFTP